VRGGGWSRGTKRGGINWRNWRNIGTDLITAEERVPSPIATCLQTICKLVKKGTCPEFCTGLGRKREQFVKENNIVILHIRRGNWSSLPRCNFARTKRVGLELSLC
jgi:hypothetical protein